MGQQTLLYTWSVVSGQNVAMQGNGARLYVAADTLTGGESYTFQLAGYPQTNPTNKGYATVVVTTPMPELVVSQWPLTMTATTTQDIILDGSKSYDPAGHPLTYSWQCTDVGTGADCRTATGAIYTFPTTASVNISAGTFTPSTLRFVLSMTCTTGTIGHP